MKLNKHKPIWSILAIGFMIVLVGFGVILNPGYVNCKKAPSQPPRIAHAGGGFKSMTYTDSVDALNANRDHYDLFEIDFNLTKDGQVVCIHDWEGSATSSFGIRLTEAPTFSEFNELNKENKNYKHCTLSSLIDWLKQNPTKRVVTDVKDNNLYVLEAIAAQYPEYANRFIPQIYSPTEYEEVRSMGYRDIIFTIYRYGKGNSKILRHSKSMNLFALTMPANRAKKLAPRASCLGIPTYAHTVNSNAELEELREYGISEIYTDWLVAY